IPAKVTAGSIDNYVYRLRYARVEVIGSVVMQLYGGTGLNLSAGLYGGMPGNSNYPATGGLGVGINGTYNGGAYNGGTGSTTAYGAGNATSVGYQNTASGATPHLAPMVT